MSSHVFNAPYPLAHDEKDQAIIRKRWNPSSRGLQLQQKRQIKTRNAGMRERKTKNNCILTVRSYVKQGVGTLPTVPSSLIKNSYSTAIRLDGNCIADGLNAFSHQSRKSVSSVVRRKNGTLSNELWLSSLNSINIFNMPLSNDRLVTQVFTYHYSNSGTWVCKCGITRQEKGTGWSILLLYIQAKHSNARKVIDEGDDSNLESGLVSLYGCMSCEFVAGVSYSQVTAVHFPREQDCSKTCALRYYLFWDVAEVHGETEGNGRGKDIWGSSKKVLACVWWMVTC